MLPFIIVVGSKFLLPNSNPAFWRNTGRPGRFRVFFDRYWITSYWSTGKTVLMHHYFCFWQKAAVVTAVLAAVLYLIVGVNSAVCSNSEVKSWMYPGVCKGLSGIVASWGDSSISNTWWQPSGRRNWDSGVLVLVQQNVREYCTYSDSLLESKILNNELFLRTVSLQNVRSVVALLLWNVIHTFSVEQKF